PGRVAWAGCSSRRAQHGRKPGPLPAEVQMLPPLAGGLDPDRPAPEERAVERGERAQRLVLASQLHEAAAARATRVAVDENPAVHDLAADLRDELAQLRLSGGERQVADEQPRHGRAHHRASWCSVNVDTASIEVATLTLQNGVGTCGTTPKP